MHECAEQDQAMRHWLVPHHQGRLCSLAALLLPGPGGAGMLQPHCAGVTVYLQKPEVE